MKIPDFIRRLTDTPEVITADNDLELLAKLYQRFEDVKKRSSRISFKGRGPILGAAPMLGGMPMMAAMDSAAAPSAPCEDEFEPSQAVPTSVEGIYMFLHKLQEEIKAYEHDNGVSSELASVKKALVDRLSKEPGHEVNPSRLIIPLSNGIELEEFGCVLDLRPLPKAVLVLFLRHPEGIVLKQRALYYRELRSIYGLFYKKDNMDEFEDSCNRLVDITDGSMDEKITMVNSTFKKNLTIALAEKYQILGKRGGVKSIQLDRSLVKLPKELDRIPLTNLKA